MNMWTRLGVAGKPRHRELRGQPFGVTVMMVNNGVQWLIMMAYHGEYNLSAYNGQVQLPALESSIGHDTPKQRTVTHGFDRVQPTEFDDSSTLSWVACGEAIAVAGACDGWEPSPRHLFDHLTAVEDSPALKSGEKMPWHFPICTGRPRCQAW